MYKHHLVHFWKEADIKVDTIVYTIVSTFISASFDFGHSLFVDVTIGILQLNQCSIQVHPFHWS